MNLHRHKPDTGVGKGTLWFAMVDRPGLLLAVALHTLLLLSETVMVLWFRLGSWAFDPVSWIHGPPLDVPAGRSAVSYFKIMLMLSMLVTFVWGWLVERPLWPDGPAQHIAGWLAWLLLVCHGVMAISLVC